jgi:hypothetical protein
MLLPWLAVTEAIRAVISRPASPASTPLATNSQNVTRSTRMPLARAASALPPIA